MPSVLRSWALAFLPAAVVRCPHACLIQAPIAVGIALPGYAFTLSGCSNAMRRRRWRTKASVLFIRPPTLRIGDSIKIFITFMIWAILGILCQVAPVLFNWWLTKACLLSDGPSASRILNTISITVALPAVTEERASGVFTSCDFRLGFGTFTHFGSEIPLASHVCRITMRAMAFEHVPLSFT